MMEIITSDNINSILLAGESSTVEFKARVKSAIHVLPKIISAFANTESGIIIFGYDERNQVVIGTSADEFEMVKRSILANNLESICNTYTVRCEEKTLIVVQVEKSNSVVIAGGGAYVRRGDSNISALSSKELVKQIETTIEKSETVSSEEVVERLEKRIEQIYNEMLRAQTVHEEEKREQKIEHEKELKESRRNNWFFCILSAIIGYGLGKFF